MPTPSSPALFAPASLARLALFGAVVGSVLDGLHTFSGTTSYPDPVFLRAAWWIPITFAAGYALEGVLYTAGRHARNRPHLPASRRWLCAFLFVGLYACSGFLPVANPTKLLLLLVGAVALWGTFDRSRETVVVAVVAALVGPATEMMLVRLGLFAHLQPDVLGVPMWLPALYLASAAGIGPLLAWVGYGATGLAGPQT